MNVYLQPLLKMYTTSQVPDAISQALARPRRWAQVLIAEPRVTFRFTEFKPVKACENVVCLLTRSLLKRRAAAQMIRVRAPPDFPACGANADLANQKPPKQHHKKKQSLDTSNVAPLCALLCSTVSHHLARR